MFYSNVMFVKKGPLAKVWLAAHLAKRLNKAQITQADIRDACKSVLDPAAPLALRLSGQLLLGIARIYARKVRYLQEDASDALTAMKTAYRAGGGAARVDAQADAITGTANAIDVVDTYEDVLGMELPSMPLDQFLNVSLGEEEGGLDASAWQRVTVAQARKDDITIDASAASLLDSLDAFAMLEDDSLAMDLGDGGVPGAGVDPDMAGGNEEQMLASSFADSQAQRARGVDLSASGLEIEVGRDDSGMAAAGPADAELDGGLDFDFGDMSAFADDGGAGGDQSMMADSFAVDESMAAAGAGAAGGADVIDDVELAGKRGRTAAQRRRQQQQLRPDKVMEISGKRVAEQLRDTSSITLKRRRMLPIARSAAVRKAAAAAPQPTPTPQQKAALLTPAVASALRDADVVMTGPSPGTFVSLKVSDDIMAAFAYAVSQQMRASSSSSAVAAAAEQPEQAHPLDGVEMAMMHEGEQGIDESGLDFSSFDYHEEEGGEAAELAMSRADDAEAAAVGAGGEGAFDADGNALEGVMPMPDDSGVGGVDDEDDGAASNVRLSSNKGWSERTRKCFTLLVNRFGIDTDAAGQRKRKGAAARQAEKAEVSFDTTVGEPAQALASTRKARAVVAGNFYELLVLKTHDYIDVRQEDAYGDIAITRGAAFNEPLPQQEEEDEEEEQEAVQQQQQKKHKTPTSSRRRSSGRV